MRNRNILVVIQTAVFGGPHNQVLQLAKGLREQGFNYLALLPEEEGNAKGRFENAGIPVFTTPYSRIRKTFNILVHLNFLKSVISDIGRVRKIIREQNIEIVQVCGLLNLQAGIAAKLEGKKVVWQLLSNYAPKFLRYIFSPLVYFCSDAVMSTGMIVANDHILIPKHPRLKSFFPPVDVNKFSLPTEEEIVVSKARLGVSNREFTIGTIGNFNKQKAHEFLIEVFFSFYNRFPNARLRILGSATKTNLDYYEEEVVLKAKGYGLLDRGICRFIEVGENVKEYAQGIDIFVLSSQSEGIPTVMLEAMALGKAIISTNVGSIAEIVTEDIGYLVTYPDGASFEEKLTLLYHDEERRKTMGENAHAMANSRFNINQTLLDHLEVFNEV